MALYAKAVYSGIQGGLANNWVAVKELKLSNQNGYI